MTTLIPLDALPKDLFWSAPLEVDADFTLEDPLALDYLSQQVGLWLFPRFTTRTSRAQYYAVVLYGLHLADKAVHELGYSGDDDTRTRLFERWERFWALATVESLNGRLDRDGGDIMRGVRGVQRTWTAGERPLPIDYPLISRQSELGGLGAYLSSLREYGLIFPGTLRPTPAAQEILDAFWGEKGERATRHQYDDYALLALKQETTSIPRSHGRLTLAGVGKRSRLSVLTNSPWPEQQARLWNVLFEHSRDGSTLPFARQIIAADADGVTDAKQLLEGFVAGRWGRLDPENQRKVEVALAFAQVFVLLLERFNRGYGHVDTNNWVTPIADVAEAAFPDAEAEPLRAACSHLREKQDAQRFNKLQFHGREFLQLLTKLLSSDPLSSLNHVLGFHRMVQRSRRGGGAWLREENGKLIMQVRGYNGYKADPVFPSMKLYGVRRLIEDLGKLGAQA